MTTKEEEDPIQDYTSIPDIGFDRSSRRLAIEGKNLPSRLEAVVREKQEIALFLDLEGGLNTYIGKIEAGEPGCQG